MNEEQIAAFRDLEERVAALESKQDELLAYIRANRDVTVENNQRLWPYLHEHEGAADARV